MKTSVSREAYRDRARAMLELWGAEITQLRSRIHLLEADARIQAMKQVGELEHLYNDAFRHYGALQSGTGVKLEEIKSAFEQTTERIRQKLDDLVEVVA